MFKFQIFLVFFGGTMAGLGLIISLSAVANGVMNIQPTLSPFDQTDDITLPDGGSAPLIVPTLRPNAMDLKDQAQSTVQPASGQDTIVSDGGLVPPIVLTLRPKTMDRKDQAQPTAQPASGQDMAVSTPVLTETPEPSWIPSRIVIPAIQLDAPVVSGAIRTIAYLGKNYPQWKVPNFFAAGWAPTSASLGVIGNTVLFGHHNEDGEVFAHLVDLQVNDLIVLYSGERKFTYAVALKMILPERNEPVGIRLQNASWILPSADERLTLLTCWPFVSNTHRLIIVAIPVSDDNLKNYLLIPRLTPLSPLTP